MNVPPKPDSITTEQMERLIAVLARLERTINDAFDAHLSAKFPYGKPVDRWRRGA